MRTPFDASVHAFMAHSLADQPEERWQTLSDHLSAVGELAARFGQSFGRGEIAGVAGLLHDLGKYTREFQDRIRGSSTSVDHATWGAKEALRRFPGLTGYLLAYGIAGHHGGLPNGASSGARTSLRDRIEGCLPALLPQWESEIAVPGTLMPPADMVRHSDLQRLNYQFSFLVRMLFSCLVDADFLDTDRFYAHAEGRSLYRLNAGEAIPLATLRDALNASLAGLQQDSPVRQLRTRVLNHVRAQATLPRGSFSLTVPTGGGKTLTSLAFALDHAIHHGMDRVIFVIPYTSIVEQNAAVFRQALGPWGEQAVLEHHSAYIDKPGTAKEARDKISMVTENWDAPIVVTTAVQFFESLFADRPSACRKLHNIANSVVVLDEAQTMPVRVLRPCVAALDELTRNFKASTVLCTATQPALEAPGFEGGLTEVRELAPDPAGLFNALRRVQVRSLGPLDDDQIRQHMLDRDQVLCIVNNRRHAAALYRSLAELPGVFHLSTFMCAKHRSAVLHRVRQALAAGEPCRLVSTSLIEAGVDVSFPTVMRAQAGLDSIAQAAGRCNREGHSPAGDSHVLIFATANPDWAPPAELRQYAAVAGEILRHTDGDPMAPDVLKRYFEKLYWQKGSEQLDDRNLLGLMARARWDTLPMETLASEFRMIDSAQLPVLIPYDQIARDAIQALKDLLPHQSPFGLARTLQPYIVQIPRRGHQSLRELGALEAIRPDRWEEQFMVLVDPKYYRTEAGEECGLHWDQPDFMTVAGRGW